MNWRERIAVDPKVLVGKPVIKGTRLAVEFIVDAGKGIRWLNELEYIDGEVYANIWQQDRIAIIQLNSGQVTGWMDLSLLRPRMAPPPRDVEGLGAYGKAVANGIAYDAARGRLFVTGKNWPKLFEIRLRN